MADIDRSSAFALFILLFFFSVIFTPSVAAAGGAGSGLYHGDTGCINGCDCVTCPPDHSAQPACSGNCYPNASWYVKNINEMDEGCGESWGNISGVLQTPPQDLKDMLSGSQFKTCSMAYTGSGGGNPCPGQNPPQKYRERFSGKCGCPSEPVYRFDGCNITVSCDLEDDDATIVKIDIPCPTVAGADPKYPLVKMLTGVLIEWRVGDKVVSPHRLRYSTVSAANPQGYGTEDFGGFNLDIVISTVDTGVKWDVEKAMAIVKGTEEHSRKNIEFSITGGNPNVTVLTAKDIYDAYKAKNRYVQAYTVLAGKNFGERPWTTYDKFVDAMCRFSASAGDCERALKGIDFEEYRGNYWLGNGNPTILGVYSETSSHGCHGASVIDDNGEPAFAFKFKSTFCIYMHASWEEYYIYNNVNAEYLGECCVNVTYYPYTWAAEDCNSCYMKCTDENGCEPVCSCQNVVRYTMVPQCLQWKDVWSCTDGFTQYSGGECSEDCKKCIEIEGWVDLSGKLHTDPYPISFYQSQPLLIQP